MTKYALYIFFFVLATFLSVLINWLFLKFSRTLGVRTATTDNQVRWSSDVKPSLGGFSFFIVFLIAFTVLSLVPSGNEESYNALLGILGASVLGFLIGLADDAYNTNPLVKFMGQLTCAFILIVSNVYIAATGNIAIDYAITTLWVIGLMNSINMLDNMDGITTSISLSILLGAIIFLLTGNQIDQSYMLLLLGVFGALLGFLFFNWNPAKIYMGDTGSQFLGVFLAAISIVFFWGERNEGSGVFQLRQFVIPMLVFIVPLIDTLTVSIRRLMRKQSPFVGGKDHTTHHLVFFGFSERQAALILLGISLASLPLAVLLHNGSIDWTFGITLCAFAYFATVFTVIQIIYNIGGKKLAKKSNE